jgi:hypothetical protein
MSVNLGWDAVQANPTLFRGALSHTEGSRIRWHSPHDPRSSSGAGRPTSNFIKKQCRVLVKWLDRTAEFYGNRLAVPVK